MSISSRSFLDIMDEYDQRRRDNELLVQSRKDALSSRIPELAAIDAEIAHISVSRAKRLLFSDEDLTEDPQLHETIHALSLKKSRLLMEHGYPADYLDPVYTCQDCQDTGYIGDERCHCLKDRLRRILLERSGLGPDPVRLSDFRTDYYSTKALSKEEVSPRENIEHILHICRDYIRHFAEIPGRNLLITGSTGVGKTFLSRCIGAELLLKDKEVLYLTAYRFFRILENHSFHRESKDERISLDDILTCDLLIIDDLGTELTNAFINSQLFLCINERILRKRSTIINTNLSLEKINRTYSERISSRFIESYKVLPIPGEDIRVRKAFSSLGGRRQSSY